MKLITRLLLCFSRTNSVVSLFFKIHNIYIYFDLKVYIFLYIYISKVLRLMLTLAINMATTHRCVFPFISQTELYTLNHWMVSKLKIHPLHHSMPQYDKCIWVKREKEQQAFSATLVFEVKILWTGPENNFSTQSTESAHSALSEMIVWPKKDSHFFMRL